MNVHTDIQIIRQGGKPAFVVVPYDKWLELTHSEDENIYIPHEVVGYQLKEGLSLIAAWRIISYAFSWIPKFKPGLYLIAT